MWCRSRVGVRSVKNVSKLLESVGHTGTKYIQTLWGRLWLMVHTESWEVELTKQPSD